MGAMSTLPQSGWAFTATGSLSLQMSEALLIVASEVVDLAGDSTC